MEYNVVGLDLGKTWGWAVIEDQTPDPPVIRFGEETAGNDALTNASAGMIYHSYRAWLLEFLDKEGPAVLCYESVRFTRGVSYIEGQKGILLAELEQREIPYFGLPIGTLKKWGAGHGRAAKEQVVQAVQDRWQDDEGADPTQQGFLQGKPWDQRWKLTDNMADALWCAHRAWVTWG